MTGSASPSGRRARTSCAAIIAPAAGAARSTAVSMSCASRYGELIRARFPQIPRRVSGYENLDQLFPENGLNVARALVGTEGTCVTVLEATLNLIPNPAERVHRHHRLSGHLPGRRRRAACAGARADRPRRRRRDAGRSLQNEGPACRRPEGAPRRAGLAAGRVRRPIPRRKPPQKAQGLVDAFKGDGRRRPEARPRQGPAEADLEGARRLRSAPNPTCRTIPTPGRAGRTARSTATTSATICAS